MRVLVFEPQYRGHNLAYVHLLAARLLELGCEVDWLTSRAAFDSVERQRHLADLPGLRPVVYEGFQDRPQSLGIRVNGYHGARSLLAGLEYGLKQSRPDHLYIPFGNPVAHWLGLPNRVSRMLKQFGTEAELVLLFGRYAYAHRGWRAVLKQRWALSMLQRGPWARIHHIVPHAVQVMSAFSPALAAKVRGLPDPVERAPAALDKVAARQLLGVPVDGQYVVLSGLIERRKGVRELLEAFERALPLLTDNTRLLLAGQATEEVRGWLQGRFAPLVARGRVLGIDRHLSNLELWASCFAADLVCTPYPNHQYSASIVIRAAAAGVPVLANAMGWMEHVVKTYQLGSTCNTRDPDQFPLALLEALEHAQRHQTTPASRRFVEYNSAENFQDQLTARLVERMGEAPTSSNSSVQFERVQLAAPPCHPAVA
jgi:glycosyltransferase involved in cell wall biosynthesis